MSWTPLLEAPVIIQIHAFGAMAAVVLGVVQIIAPKGALPHKAIGVVWIAIMAVIAVSSIFIRPALVDGLALHEWFSPIHLFSLLTFYALGQGIYLLARGGATMKYHSRPFIGLFIGGLVVAGVLSFLPGRIMHQVAFGG
ncbi:MAG: hypothetical protein R3C51_09740 [Parvularculaceae bacterium]